MKTKNLLFLATLMLAACQPAPPSSEDSSPVKDNSSDMEITTHEAEDKLSAMGITLPSASAPVATYVNSVQSGKLIFLSGKGPTRPDGTNVTGKVGADLTQEEGYEAAKWTAINQLAVLKTELGNLDRVKRIVKVLGMVNCTPDFQNQPEVINGYSDLMVAVFGEKGRHARSAVGMGSLPRNIAVEVEMIVEIY